MVRGNLLNRFPSFRTGNGRLAYRGGLYNGSAEFLCADQTVQSSMTRPGID
jgi:hypothetical protein